MPITIPIIETDRQKLQKHIANASNEAYKIAKAAYGPGSGNVILGFRHGAPMLSRDGVTNLMQVRLPNEIEDDIAQVIHQASRKNNETVGDGTTAVTILQHHLLMAAQRMEAMHINPMQIAAKLKEAEQIVLAYIDTVRVDVKDPVDVATVAAGDPELGAMIADVVEQIGTDGVALIEQYEGLGIHPEVTNGFYFRKGFLDVDLINDAANNQANYENVSVLISNKAFKTEVDLGPVLQKVIAAGHKELVIIADFGQDATQVLKMMKAKGLAMITPVEPPYSVGGRSLFLDDLALRLGSTVYDGVEFDAAAHLGKADEVLIGEWSTTIMGGNDNQDAVQERIGQLKEQLKELDNPNSIHFAKDRLSRLEGKMAIIKVGGATEFERDEVKLRVQDAVCAVQSALKEGIVPGGGSTLAHVTGTEFDDAFREPFKQLVANCGLNPEAYLAKLDDKDAWLGFNLRNVTDKPVNLLEVGVVDPSLVIKAVVRNAISIVSGLITASAAIAQPEEYKE